jgi:outer membrane protein assembly factor BamE (lipoprotein component of BamABCDE complex)
MKMASNFNSNTTRLSSSFAMKVGIALITANLVLSGCTTEKVLSNGPNLDETQMQLVPVGSSRDQVLLALGTPSTTGTFDNEVFYYISQKRTRRYAYQKLKLIDQRVVAIYFDDQNVVSQVADYRLQDGKVFDFISRTTPTGGRDITLLSRLFGGGARKDDKPVVPQLGGLGGS